MPSKNYMDLIAWQKAMDLAQTIYSAAKKLPPDERFGLCSQMRRAAVSVPANIAEGEGRRTDGEFVHLLSVAHGSVRELETHVMLAERLGYFDREAVKRLLADAGEVGRLVKGLSNSRERRL